VCSLRLKSCFFNVQHVCHSAVLRISDIIAIYWYCYQWTETGRTTRPRLPLSAVPQFQTVIAIYSLMQGSRHCIIYQVQVWIVCSPHHRLDWGDFSLCRYLMELGGVRRCAVMLQKHVVLIHFGCAFIVNIIMYFLHRTIYLNLLLTYVKNY